MFQLNRLQNLIFTILILFNINIYVTNNNINGTIDYLDTTFGPNANGIVTTAITGSTSAQINAATNSGGNIIVAGNTTINNNNNIVVARYTSAGVLDTTFNSSGSQPGVITTVSGSSSNANAVIVDSNSKIVIAGGDGSNNVLVARYTSAGVLDSTFGIGGIATLTIGNGATTSAITIDANGNILVAGTAVVSGIVNLFVARFTSLGVVDPTFNITGFNTVTGTSGSFSGFSIVIDQNAKILVGGSAHTNTGSDFLIVRFTTTGAVDTAFGTNGIVQTTVTANTSNSIQSLSVDASNRIVAEGYSNTGSASTFSLARYLNTGLLDVTFGAGATGIVTTTIGTVAQIFGGGIDQSGNIVATGVSDTGVATARYTANGSLDTTFGVSGVLTTAIGSLENSSAKGLTVQSTDGRVVIGGFTEVDAVSGALNFALIRYNKNNTDFVNITSIADNSTKNTKIPVVSGTSNGKLSPQASVQVIVNGVNLGSAVNTDGSGNWNAGNTNVLPIGSNKIQANLIVNSATVVSHVTLFTVTDNLSEDAVFAYNSTSQTTSTLTTFATLPFDNIILGTSSTSPQGTWSFASNTFTCNKAGRYYIHYLGHAGSTTIGTATSIDVATMISINGTEYVGSEANANVDLTANVTRMVSKGFVKDLNANDTISLNFAINRGGAGSVTAGLLTNTTSVGTQHAYSLAITRIG